MAIGTSPADGAMVRFPSRLGLPAGPESLLKDAATAVRREYRNSVRWKRLRCHHVAPVQNDSGEPVFILDVGRSVEFDWTWEGAVAFRPEDVQGFRGDVDQDDTLGDEGPDQIHGEQLHWSGEVVEVDETTGRIFVSVSNPQRPPLTGSFFVRPFEFLAFLHALYCQGEFADLRMTLPGRLLASRGETHPAIDVLSEGGLEALRPVWGHSWGILWGPPGTGKTHTIGRQVASCLEGGSERVLIISTTNRATDAVAISIGRASFATQGAALEDGRLIRIGKGADFDEFRRHGLAGMLRGTETELLREVADRNRELARATDHESRAILRKQIQGMRRQIKDIGLNALVSPDVRVVVSTAHKAVALLTDPTVRAAVAEGTAPFTTVIIDEAGLIPRALAAGLSLLASDRVLLVGDPKQLAPISKISRILPTSQAVWLGSSPLSHLDDPTDVNPGVHLLREQYRMHPEVSRVVSAYQYGGQVRDAAEVQDRRFEPPATLAEQPRAIWYVLDDDTDDLPSIRAERGPGNRSWVRPRTRAVLKKLLGDGTLGQTMGLFITPFTAQARDIAGFLAGENLEKWASATVHSYQGMEAECVIFDTVNAGSTGWAYDEWKRLVNVGLSRAREFVVVLASRAEMREPYLRGLAQLLEPRVLRRCN